MNDDELEEMVELGRQGDGSMTTRKAALLSLFVVGMGVLGFALGCLVV